MWAIHIFAAHFRLFKCVISRLEELFLCLNEYTTVTLAAMPCPTLRLLHITDNNLHEWNEVRKFGSMFPALDTLIMANNNLNSIQESGEILHRLFPNLRSINLHNSGIIVLVTAAVEASKALRIHVF